MVRANIRFSGVEDVLRNLNALPGQLDRYVIADGLKAGADVLRNAARQTVEFEDDTGALRKTIRSRKSRSKVSAQVLAGGKRANYAFFVEYGTIFLPPRPYLESALVANEGLIYDAMVTGMRLSFQELGRRLTTGSGITREIRRLARR